MKGTEFVVDAIVREGIDHAFLVPGGLIDSFYPALCQTPGITPIVAAHEGGAAYMADGYARASGRFGLCFCIGGPGATNTVTALATAVSDESPLLLVTGEMATNLEGLGGFQDASPDGLDDISTLKTVSRLSLSIENPLVLRQHLLQALATMLGLTRGPVHLSVPVDVQQAQIEHKYLPSAAFLQSYEFASAAATQEIWKHLDGSAVKVAILAGAGTERDGGPELLRQFAEKYDVPVATTLRAKGVLPEDHPLSLGVFGYAGTRPAIEALLSSSLDVLIVLGSGLNQRDTLFWNRDLRSCKTLVQVDKNPEHLGATYAVDLPIVGHCDTVLGQLLESPAASTASFAATRAKRTAWLENLRALPRLYDVENCASDAVPIHPARVIHELQQVMPRDTTLVIDSGAHRAFAGHYWQALGPRQYISATNIGPMGWAIPAGIGVKLARPEPPCVVVTGDGCMRMHGMELATAARYGVAVIYLVINNGALGNVYLRAKKMGPGPAEMTELPLHDWVAFGKSLGVEGWRVERPGDLAATFKKALALGGPCVVDVRCGRDYSTPVTPYTESQHKWHE
jgi:acetolactate synthase I/II/III large subunit